MNAEDIVSIAIHPAVGVARIGNARDDWFLAAEICGATPEDADGFRDAEGRIKRQVARFRIYATMKSGKRRELTAEDAEIEWRVEVANLKSGWYKFHYPLDLPVPGVAAPTRRNVDVSGDHRERLNIRPTPRKISGPDRAGTQFHFDDGTFFEKPVYLGELRTDAAGRLLFFGGRGDSAPIEAGTRPTTFANNDGWYDDVCDGPVRASISIGGRVLEAAPAHVVVAPPNYGPGLFGIVTMDDVVRDLYMRTGWLERPAHTSFSRDIWPIFDRLTGHQWVNDGIFLVAGDCTPLDARDAKVIDRMRDASAGNAAFRSEVLAMFRKPGENRPEALPPIYGDALSDRGPGGLLDPTRQEMPLTDTQLAHLENWATGQFDSDWQGFPDFPVFDSLPPEEQVEQLDRAGLHECLGGPFHPGIEITWPMRLKIMWQAPYRLNALPEGTPVRQDFGSHLSVADALAPDGPHGASGPGSLTRWLGVPWQTDEASCNSGLLYSPELYLSSPSFWGTRVPNQVLSQDAFALATDPSLTATQVDRHFSNRHLWLRDINGRGYLERIDAMVTRWWRLGLVAAQPVPADSNLPVLSFVETGRRPDATSDPTRVMLDNSLALDKPDGVAAGLATGAGTEAKVSRDYKTFDRGEV